MLCTRGKLYCFICMNRVNTIGLPTQRTRYSFLFLWLTNTKLQNIDIPPLLHVITCTWLDFLYNLFIYAAFSHLPDIKSLTASKHKVTLSKSHFSKYIYFALKTTLELWLRGDEAAFPVTPLFAIQPWYWAYWALPRKMITDMTKRLIIMHCPCLAIVTRHPQSKLVIFQDSCSSKYPTHKMDSGSV